MSKSRRGGLRCHPAYDQVFFHQVIDNTGGSGYGNTEVSGDRTHPAWTFGM